MPNQFQSSNVHAKRVKCERWKVLRVMDYLFCIFSLSTLNSALSTFFESRLTAGRASEIK